MVFANLTKREKTITVLTILFVAIFLLYTQVVERVIKRWMNLDKEITSKSIKLKKDIKLLSKKDTIEKEYKKFLSSIKSGMSEEEEAANVLADIETVAKNNSFSIINIKPSPSIDTPSYKEIIFEVSSESGINELIKFIYDLQSLKKLIKVKRLSLSAKVAEAGTLKSTLYLTKILIK